MNGGWDIFYEIALRWMPLDLTGDRSTLVQVMAWCRQATRHYLSQCWPRSLSPYGVTRAQWVKATRFRESLVYSAFGRMYYRLVNRGPGHQADTPSYLIPVTLPWIFLRAPLKVNGAPGNMQSSFTGMDVHYDKLRWIAWPTYFQSSFTCK